MKDFHEMTASEIRNYRGPVHWARISALSPDGTRMLPHDLEHSTAEALAAHLAQFRYVQIHRRGVNEHAKGNPNYEGVEGIDYPSQRS